MRSLNHARWSGIKQGMKDKAFGFPLRACPYKQWPLHQLRKYQAWVEGWWSAYK